MTIRITVEKQVIRIGSAIPVGGGECNTGVNVGAGAGVFRDKVGAALNFRSLTGSSGIVVTAGADEVDIAGSSPSLPHGELWAEDQATDLSLPTLNQWEQYTQFEANGQGSGATPDYTNGHITINTAGIYLVAASIMFEATNNQEFEWEVQKNNGATRLRNLHTGNKTTNLGQQVSSSISGLASFLALDTVELWARCVTTSGAFVRGRDVNLLVVRIG